MKKEHAIRTLLGLTQTDAAMLFGVHRSQWSMFESGKRDLPPPATQMLAQILTHLQSTEQKSKRAHAQKRNPLQTIEKLLHENQYQTALVARKITAAAKKQESQTRRSQLANFLSQHTALQQSRPGIVALISSKAAQNNQDYCAILFELEHQRALLAYEQSILESGLRQIKKRPKSSK